MRNTKHLLIALLTLGIGTLAAAGCSAHLGRRVWSRVRHAYEEGGLGSVEDVIRSFPSGAST